MVYDMVPRVTAACFLSRTVFSALTGAVHGLPTADMAEGVFIPVPTVSLATRLGILTARDTVEGEGHGLISKSK